jgi:hypothetical protein
MKMKIEKAVVDEGNRAAHCPLTGPESQPRTQRNSVALPTSHRRAANFSFFGQKVNESGALRLIPATNNNRKHHVPDKMSTLPS